jgi:hypothetical protein
MDENTYVPLRLFARLIGNWKLTHRDLTSRQSGMSFKGEFSKDGDTVTGTWKWPCGGYDLVMQREENYHV